MKTLLITLLMFFAAFSAQALDITLAWDLNDPTELVAAYRIYKKNADGSLVQVGTTNGTTNTITLTGLPVSPYTFVCTAIDDRGLESLPSNEATSRGAPGAPKNLKITNYVK